MRILVAGECHTELHEEAVYQAFLALGHDPIKFSWLQYFKVEGNRLTSSLAIKRFSKKFQNKFIVGPIISRINRDFIHAVNEVQPDLVYLARGTHITRATLQTIKRHHPSIILLGSPHDNPFAAGHPFWLWRHLLAGIPEYDLIIALRHGNLADFMRAGAKRVHLLRSWFVPERSHPVSLSAEEQARFGCDVVFVGHYEPDDRVAYLEEIVRHGFALRLFGAGHEWDPVIARSAFLRHLRPVQFAWGEDYNRALCGAKVALCFFSKLNRDTYTYRCFEIPATKTLMLSEYSSDLATLYTEGVEADFFRSKQELIQKLRLYLQNDALREAVALAGYRRVIADGHDVVSRMRLVLDWAAEF